MTNSKLVLIAWFAQFVLFDVKSDIAPPGVNPALYENAHYQHPQPGGIPQSQQMHMGQPGMHMGQPGMQQPNIQQPQYMAQPPAQHHAPQGQFAGQQHFQHQPPQAHAGHHGSNPVLHTGNIQQEREHIAEHMDVPLDTSKMSEHELQFHYFKMHDNDNNNKLDGCELIKSLIHWHEQGHDQPPGGAPGAQTGVPKLFNDEELIQLIDPILKMDDTNQDGYIDYTEFVRAQQKAASATG